MKTKLKWIIKEETRKYLNEMANPAAVDPKLLPKNLDDVDMETAKKLATSGLKDGEKEEDKVPVNKGAFTTAELKPSQSSMDINKALGMVISMLDPKTDFNAGGDIGAFISSDKYIMDGHHRWIATSMIDPSKKIIGYAVNFPGEKLVAVLNTVTKGMWNIGKGKKAKGGFEQFTPEKIGETLEGMLTKGGKHHTPEQVQKIVKAWAGSPEGFVKKVVANLSKITMATPSWASGRPQMPVIDPDITKDPKTYYKTVGALQKGVVNVNPPYKIQESLKRIIKEELTKYLKENKPAPDQIELNQGVYTLVYDEPIEGMQTVLDPAGEAIMVRDVTEEYFEPVSYLTMDEKHRVHVGRMEILDNDLQGAVDAYEAGVREPRGRQQPLAPETVRATEQAAAAAGMSVEEYTKPDPTYGGYVKNPPRPRRPKR